MSAHCNHFCKTSLERWLLPMSRTSFRGPKNVRAFKVRLFCDSVRHTVCGPPIRVAILGCSRAISLIYGTCQRSIWLTYKYIWLLKLSVWTELHWICLNNDYSQFSQTICPSIMIKVNHLRLLAETQQVKTKICIQSIRDSSIYYLTHNSKGNIWPKLARLVLYNRISIARTPMSHLLWLIRIRLESLRNFSDSSRKLTFKDFFFLIFILKLYVVSTRWESPGRF